MKKKHSNENYNGYLADLRRELSSVKLPAIVLTFTLAAALTLPYLGEKITQLASCYNIQNPNHTCTFINFEQADQRQKIETIVAQNVKTFSLLSGAEQLGTTLLEEIPNIASIKCSLDRDRTVRLVITGNQVKDNEQKDLKIMQVHQHQIPQQTSNAQPKDIVSSKQITATFADTFELLLSSTDALFSKPQQLPPTFHAIVQQRNSTDHLRSINFATNDSSTKEPILSHKEPSLSYKGNQL